MTYGNAVTAGIIYALTELLGLSGSGHLAVPNSITKDSKGGEDP